MNPETPCCSIRSSGPPVWRAGPRPETPPRGWHLRRLPGAGCRACSSSAPSIPYGRSGGLAEKRAADRAGAPDHDEPGVAAVGSDGPSRIGGEAGVSSSLTLYTPCFWHPWAVSAGPTAVPCQRLGRGFGLMIALNKPGLDALMINVHPRKPFHQQRYPVQWIGHGTAGTMTSTL